MVASTFLASSAPSSRSLSAESTATSDRPLTGLTAQPAAIIAVQVTRRLLRHHLIVRRLPFAGGTSMLVSSFRKTGKARRVRCGPMAPMGCASLWSAPTV